MKLFVVIDTNVLVSALLSKHLDSATVKVMQAIYSSEIIPVYNNQIISEYKDVLSRDKFHFSNTLVQTLIHSIRDNGINVERIDTGLCFDDPDDLVFYEVYLAAQEKNSLLVTGNSKHFPKELFI